MAQTATQVKNSASVVQIAVGRHIESSTAVAVTFTTGFRPLYVRVVNNTSSDKEEWFHGMAAASAHKQVATGTSSAITTLGITQLSYGFTFGLDTDLNVSAEQVSWLAIG